MIYIEHVGKSIRLIVYEESTIISEAPTSPLAESVHRLVQ